MKGHFFHKNDIVARLENALNKTLGKVDVNNVFKKTKNKPKITGIAGNVIEQSVLGLSADNKQRPDLDIDGVNTELKTTGIRMSKKEKGKYEAKEPMSITAVSPNQIVKEEFDRSNFWHKLENMLLVYYHYDSDLTVKSCEYSNFYIRGYQFHQFNKEDKIRLKNDWMIVRDFIKDLQNSYENPEKEYPRISSELRSRLLYIDTAPKWPNKPRFRLKRSVVTSLVQNHFGDRLEQLPNSYTSYSDIEERCSELTKQYQGKTILNLVEELGIEINKEKIPKSISEQIIVRMFGGKSKKINKIELFNKIGIIPKTITLTKKGTRTEDMKLLGIDFDEWTNEDIPFEESSIYDYFANHQFICIIFEEPYAKCELYENKFVGFKRLTFNEEMIETNVKKVWNEVRELISEDKLIETVRYNKNNKPIINKNGVISTEVNFPKAKDNNIFLRGSGSDSKDKNIIINGINVYRHNLWIKGRYIADYLKEVELL